MDLIGDMRQTAVLCLNNPSVQGAGTIDSYGAFLTTRAKLQQSNGSRSITFAEIEGSTGWTLITRYQQAIADNISISAKWLINSELYTIDSWEKIEERNFYYKFRLNKKQPLTTAVTGLDDISAPTLQAPLYLDAVEGQVNLSTGLGVNDEVLTVARSGLIYKKVVAAPAQFEFTYSAGVLTFGVAFNAGETVYVLYKSV